MQNEEIFECFTYNLQLNHNNNHKKTSFRFVAPTEQKAMKVKSA